MTLDHPVNTLTSKLSRSLLTHISATTTRIVALAVVCILLFGFAPQMQAQLSTATMFGTVTDSTGAVLPGATLTFTQTLTNFSRQTQTNGQGEYRAEFLPVGPYTVKVDAKGFKQWVQSGISLAAAQEAALNFTLQVGSESAEVTVTSDVPLVNAGNSTLGSSIDNRAIDNLPLVGRDAMQLVTLTPGVQSGKAPRTPSAFPCITSSSTAQPTTWLAR